MNALTIFSLSSAFMGFEKDVTKGIWYIKKHETPHLTMTDEMKKRNERLEIYRRYIEQTFGDVKARFRVVFEPFRNDRCYIDSIWRLCCAIHNIVVDYFQSPSTFNTSWTGPIPKLEPPQRRRVHKIESPFPTLMF
jgi:hypothetical protein